MRLKFKTLKLRARKVDKRQFMACGHIMRDSGYHNTHNSVSVINVRSLTFIKVKSGVISIVHTFSYDLIRIHFQMIILVVKNSVINHPLYHGEKLCRKSLFML